MQTSEQITRKSASNLALAFALLPKAKQVAMSALYAFCREVDDVADNESVDTALRRSQLAEWRQDVLLACTPGASPSHPVNRELQPVIEHFRLPFELFDELVRGVEMDLDTLRYPDPNLLELYCYRVASVVGLLSIEIFGYTNPACRNYAIALGKALQFTNILRDVGNDAARGRIYLPESDLRQFRVSPDEILAGQSSDRFLALAAHTAGRARFFFAQARQLLPPEDRRSMVAAELMGAVYWKLLQKLERENFPVLSPTPAKLTKACKIRLVLLAWIRNRLGLSHPSYGV